MTSAVTAALTLTVIASLEVHPFASVTVVVYVLVALGLAIGFETVLLLNPVVGLQT